MIPQAYITAWQRNAPWQENYQIEQDLIIHRALVILFNDEFLNKRHAFRGGTALYKLFLVPAARYSEDIDLVQLDQEPVGTVIDKIRALFTFLGDPRIKQKQHNNTLIFSILSEDNVPLKLKIEINTREHHSVFGVQKIPFALDSEWDFGKALIPTYQLEELLATKLRALYQRKKGRDLFDLWYAFQHSELNVERIIHAFYFYMEKEGNTITQQDFLLNMENKMEDTDFRTDMNGLLRNDINYNIDLAFLFMKERLLDQL
jgi:predicted nucleotidyltransferase component of viral defense system